MAYRLLWISRNIFENNNLPCEVLAASFKNSQQVLELTKYGIGAATIGCEVIENLIKNKQLMQQSMYSIQILLQLQAKGRQWLIANSQSLSNRRVSPTGGPLFFLYNKNSFRISYYIKNVPLGKHTRAKGKMFLSN